MNTLEIRLSQIDPNLFSKFEESKREISLMLGKYSNNFPTYTDHSSHHTLEVFKIAAELLSDEEIENLNADEVYILSMACLLHDVGMCVPEQRIKEISDSNDILAYKDSHPNLSVEEFIRDIHHQLSNKFILQEWQMLKIPSLKYAKAIGLVAEGHRKVDLSNFEIYDPQYFAKSGKEFVCMPYLACILRIADELDITNSRTPKLLTKYYMPNNSVSIREWTKHIATSQRNYLTNKVIFEVDCSDQNIYAALQDQFDKIQNVINYCQKIVRSIPYVKTKPYSLNLSLVDVKYNFIGFHPKGIRFSFDVQNVVTAFIGEDLYKDKLTSLREAIQNSIDSCRYKQKVLKEVYSPSLKIYVHQEYLRIEDNGAGMDEFIIENFFGRLASSFYEQEKIKTQFEAIGQFGVGVFSYFLLSEYIDIETKTAKSSTVKFRFDKDPKSYFHFYDKWERTTPGTTITLYLKKEIIGRLSFVIIENYLKRVFRHIEIPIEVSGENNKSVIEFQGYELDSDKEIKERLKLQDKKLSSQVKSVKAEIDDDDVEGTCLLLIGKDYLDTFKYHSFFDSDQFKTFKHGHFLSQISVSQKGIFVNNYTSSSLTMLIGDINLKKKIKINIDRNEFTNEEQVHKIIQKFEIIILNKVFTLLNDCYIDNTEKVLVSDSFISNYLNFDPDLINQQYIDIIITSIYVKVFYKNRTNILNLKSLFSLKDEVILVSDEEDSSRISKETGRPVLTANESAYVGIYNDLSRLLLNFLGCTDYILFHHGRYYKVFQQSRDSMYDYHIKQLHDLLGNNYFDFSKINSPRLVVNIWKNKTEITNSYFHDGEIYFNYNHSFIAYIISNYKEIGSSSVYRKIIKSVFRYLQELSQGEIKNENLKKLNEIIQPLNSICKIKNFKSSDFDF
ncbi:MAG: ATP-binding protein [Chitinophagales bacterium]|nr:ATP-binding protein [Chitinophagales bacterium]